MVESTQATKDAQTAEKKDFGSHGERDGDSPAVTDSTRDVLNIGERVLIEGDTGFDGQLGTVKNVPTGDSPIDVIVDVDGPGNGELICSRDFVVTIDELVD